MLYYIKYELYKLENIKIAFEHHWQIYSKLYQQSLVTTLNYI